jgi:hypothetical protein
MSLSRIKNQAYERIFCLAMLKFHTINHIGTELNGKFLVKRQHRRHKDYFLICTLTSEKV